MTLFAPRIFRLFVDGVSFDILPMFFPPQTLSKDNLDTNSLSNSPFEPPSLNPSSSVETAQSSLQMDSHENRSYSSGEYEKVTIPIKKLAFHNKTDSQYIQPVWLIGRLE